MTDWSTTVALTQGRLECHPATSQRFGDLETVFGERGVARKCFCMWWRRPVGGTVDDADNKEKFKGVVEAGPPPGLIGYLDGTPVGWVQVGPRADFPALDRSKTLGRLDTVEVWSINCFVVRTGYRNRGVGSALALAAVEYGRWQGAEVLEAYPYDDTAWSAGNYFTGTTGMFEELGFEEVARRKPTRPIVRLDATAQDSEAIGSSQAILPESPQSLSKE